MYVSLIPQHSVVSDLYSDSFAIRSGTLIRRFYDALRLFDLVFTGLLRQPPAQCFMPCRSGCGSAFMPLFSIRMRRTCSAHS